MEYVLSLGCTHAFVSCKCDGAASFVLGEAGATHGCAVVQCALSKSPAKVFPGAPRYDENYTEVAAVVCVRARVCVRAC